jgi:hypothetical protein
MGSSRTVYYVYGVTTRSTFLFTPGYYVVITIPHTPYKYAIRKLVISYYHTFGGQRLKPDLG